MIVNRNEDAPECQLRFSEDATLPTRGRRGRSRGAASQEARRVGEARLGLRAALVKEALRVGLHDTTLRGELLEALRRSLARTKRRLRQPDANRAEAERNAEERADGEPLKSSTARLAGTVQAISAWKLRKIEAGG